MPHSGQDPKLYDFRYVRPSDRKRIFIVDRSAAESGTHLRPCVNALRLLIGLEFDHALGIRGIANILRPTRNPGCPIVRGFDSLGMDNAVRRKPSGVMTSAGLSAGSVQVAC